jgi:hypothetical protein
MKKERLFTAEQQRTLCFRREKTAFPVAAVAVKIEGNG